MFKTARLTIRNVKAKDLVNIHDLLSVAQTDEFNTLGIPESIHASEIIMNEWLWPEDGELRKSYVLCVEITDTQRFIGLISLNLGKANYRSGEVWYKTHIDHWGKGYTTEALLKLLDFGFTKLMLHRIEAGCAVENRASVRVLEKSGMKREGIKRKNLPIRGEWKDNYFYAILEEDFSINR